MRVGFSKNESRDQIDELSWGSNNALFIVQLSRIFFPKIPQEKSEVFLNLRVTSVRAYCLSCLLPGSDSPQSPIVCENASASYPVE